MTIPHTARIGALVLATTAFYGYVGQLVPQKEVQPPQEIALRSDMTTADMVKVGGEIMAGKGLCLTCHTIGKTGALRFPDLDGVAVRAASRIPGMSDIDYLAQSLYEPDTYIVEGFNPGMPAINKPPIGLTDQEILTVIAFLQTLGGTPTVTLQTTHRYYAGPAAPAGTPGPAAAPAPGAEPGKPQPLTGPKKGAQLKPVPAHGAQSAPAREGSGPPWLVAGLHRQAMARSRRSAPEFKRAEAEAKGAPRPTEPGFGAEPRLNGAVAR